MDLDLLLGLGRFVLATTLLLLLTVPTAFVVIQMELKIIAQHGAAHTARTGSARAGCSRARSTASRCSPRRTTVPDQADRATFTLAPWMVFMAAAMSMLVIPFAPGAVAADFNIGIVYFFAVLGLSVVGLLVAGWASYNKYSLLGGLRSAAQMVSYEIPLTLSVVGAVVLAGTLNFSELIEWQRDHGWIFCGSSSAWGSSTSPSLAEINRTPFDMVEADSELVAGPFTEYSGMRFGFFFFAEYVALFIMSGIMVTLFFGGWLAPWPFPAQLGGFIGTLYGIFWFFLKTYIFVFVAVWLRATLPRVRVDQLMGDGLEGAPAAGAREPVRHRHRGRGASSCDGACGAHGIPGRRHREGHGHDLRKMFAPKVTRQYPEERPQMPDRWRGRLDLIYDPFGEHKCEVCFQCAQVCPVEAIDMSGFDSRATGSATACRRSTTSARTPTPIAEPACRRDRCATRRAGTRRSTRPG